MSSHERNESTASGYSSLSDGSDPRTRRSHHDLPPECLNQLTNLLRMPLTVQVANPDKAWLDKQETHIKSLDQVLRRPKNLIDRLTTRVENYRHPERTAILCSSHRGLNSRVIRHFMLLVAQELTQRSDRFRTWRCRISFPDSLLAWLDRLDTTTALWIGRDAFFAVFGYGQPGALQTVESKCEACTLAIIGGRPQILIDLRASMIPRQNRYPRGGRIKPRLWDTVESWISQFDSKVSEAVLDASDALADQIRELNKDIKAKKEERAKGRSGETKPPSERRHRREKHKDAKLPRPRQPPRIDASEDSILIEFAYVPGGTAEQPHDQSREQFYEHQASGSLSREFVPRENDVESMGNETWGWLDYQMQARGYTPEQSQAMMRDVHPVFSDYGPRSAIPAPLARDKAPSQSSWATITVHTEDEEDQSGSGQVRPLSQIPELESTETLSRRYGTPYQWCKEDEEDEVDEEEDEDDGGSYIPARREWPFNDNHVTTQGHRPASSVYSSHPGFRRSVRDEESTIFSTPSRVDRSGSSRAL